MMKQISKLTTKIAFTRLGAIISAIVLILAYAILNAVGFVAPQTKEAQATIPKYINFQGKLTNVSNGTNVANGSYSFEFKLYTLASGGSLVWTETWDGSPAECPQLTVTNGVFNAKLGSCNPLTGVDFTTGSLFLSVNFNPGAGFDGEMSPRKQLMSSAYAFVANSVSGEGVINTANQSATALTVGRTSTDAALQVDTNTASSATGLKVTSAAAGGGIALTTISSGTNENLTLDAKGSGTISLGATSTGDILLGGGSGSTGCTVTNSTGALDCRVGISSGVAGASIGAFNLSGNTSGTVSILPQAAAGTYNFNLPTTAGNSGYFLTSAGGAGSPMTWTDPSTITAGAVLWNNITSPTADQALTFDDGEQNTWTVNSDTENFQTINADSLTTASLFNLASSSTAITSASLLQGTFSGAPAASWTGDLAKFEATSADTDLDGNILKLGYTGAAAGDGTVLNVTTAQTGTSAYALRVNDDGTYTDSTPFVVDASGNVGIGDPSPTALLTVGNGDLFQIALNGNLTTSNAGTWTFSNDTDFALTGGTNGLSIDGTTFSVDGASNRVGIGTAAPGYALQVNSPANAYGFVNTDGTRSVGTYLGTSGAYLGTISNHDLQFFTNSGAASMTLDTSGRLGIGTTPSYRLDVSGQARIGSSYATSYQLSVQTAGATSWIEILNNGGAGKGAFFGMTSNDFQLWNYQGGIMSFYTGASASTGTERMRIANTGEVGINTAGPDRRLDILDQSGPQLRLTYTDSTAYADLQSPLTGGLIVTANNLATTGTAGLQETFTIGGSGVGQTYYGNRLSITNSQITNANTLYGQYISFTDAGSLANTITGLYVDASTANGSDTTYAAVFAGGNVGIGDASPTGLLTVGSGDAFTINSSGAITAATGITSSGTITFSGLGGGGTQCVQVSNTGVLSGAGSACGTGSVAWNAITNPTGTQSLTFDDAELNAWTVSSDTETFETITANSLTTGTLESYILNGLTTGTGLSITSSSTAITSASLLQGTFSGAPAASWTGDLAKFEATSADTDLDGNILKLGYTGAAAGDGTVLNVTTAQTGTSAYALRVNDDGTYTDSTPFVVDASGQIGVQTTSLSDYLMTLAGTTGNDNSRIISITQANDASEDSTAFNLVNTVNPGAVDDIARNIRNSYTSLTPTASVSTTASSSLLNVFGQDTRVSAANITMGTDNAGGTELYIYGDSATITASPTINDTVGNDTKSIIIAAQHANLDGSATYTNVAGAGAGILSMGLYATNNAASPGDALVSYSSYGVYGLASGNLTTTGFTSHYGGYFYSSGTADTNYGIVVDVVGATTNYAGIFTGGNVGIGDTTPDQLLEVLSSDAANTQLSVGNTNAGDYDAQIGLELVDGTNTFTLGVDDSDSDKFKISTTALGTNDRFVIDASGNVTITDLTSGGTQCVQASSTGELSGTGAACGTGSVAWNAITNPTGTQSLTFDDAELNSWTVSSDTETFETITANSLTTGTLESYILNGLTTGTGLSITSSSTAITSASLLQGTFSGAPAASWTGDLAKFEATSADVDLDGNILKLGYTGAAAGDGTVLNVTTAQTGTSAYALRVNDDGTYTDSTPFVVDAAGQVGIGAASPGAKLETVGSIFVTANSVTPASAGDAPLVIRGSGNTNQQLMLGYNTTSDFGEIQAVKWGDTYKNLVLNINGGNVGIGNSSNVDTKLFVQGTSVAAAAVGTEEEFKIFRPLNGGNSYPQAAALALGTYDATHGGDFSPKTRLDIKLKSGASNDSTTNITVMTLQDNGNVGIGDISPANILTVTGAASISSVLQVGQETVATYSRLGAGSTGHSLGAADDLLISDDLEVDGDAWFDTSATFAAVRSLYDTVLVVDGNGDADYTTIASAITAANGLTPSATNRILIYVLPGRYAENISLTSSYVSLIGSSRDSVEVNPSSGALLSISGSLSGVEVKDISFVPGNTATTAGTLSSGTISGISCVWLDASANCSFTLGAVVFENNTIAPADPATTSYGASITVNNASAVVRNNNIVGGAVNAPSLNVTANARVERNYVANTTSGGNTVALTASDGTFYNNTFYTDDSLYYGSAGSLSGGTYYNNDFIGTSTCAPVLATGTIVLNGGTIRNTGNVYCSGAVEVAANSTSVTLNNVTVDVSNSYTVYVAAYTGVTVKANGVITNKPLTDQTSTIAKGSTWNYTSTAATDSAIQANGGAKILAGNAGNIGAIIQAAASQTANIQEWQNSSGTPLALINASGDFTIQSAVRTTGSPSLFTVTGPAHTTLTASVEAPDINFNLARTVQFSTGALTDQRAIKMMAPTYGFVGASTITNAATLYIDRAPQQGTNATITNAYSLWVNAGTSRFDGNINVTSSGTLKARIQASDGLISAGPAGVKIARLDNSTIDSNDATINYSSGGMVAIDKNLVVQGGVYGNNAYSLTTSNLTIGQNGTSVMGAGAGSGNVFLVNTDVAQSGGNLLDLQNNDVSKLSVDYTGAITSATLTSGGDQCLKATSAGVITGTGAACGAGAPAWTSIAAPVGDQSLTFDDDEQNTWTVSSDTENFHTINANSLTTASLITLASSGATQATNKFIDIAQTGVTTGYTGNLINLSSSSTTGAATFINLTADASTVGIGQAISMDALTSGTLIDLTSSSASQSTGKFINIAQTGVTTGYTGNLINLSSSSTTGSATFINLTADASTVGTGQAISMTALTTGKAQTITLGSALTTGGALSVTGASYNHGAVEVGSVQSLSFTDATSGAFASTTNGTLISPTINITAGAATKTINGVSIEPTFTACTTATCNVNGVNIANVADSGNFTSSAIKLGTGWDTLISGTTAGTNIFSFTNSSLTTAGAATFVGVNSGTGLIQGTGGLTITGTTNINATGTAATNIGNSTGVLTIASGGSSGWTNTSGNLTLQTATSGNIVLNSTGGTIELQDSTNVTGNLDVSGAIAVGNNASIDANNTLYIDRNSTRTGHSEYALYSSISDSSNFYANGISHTTTSTGGTRGQVQGAYIMGDVQAGTTTDLQAISVRASTTNGAAVTNSMGVRSIAFTQGAVTNLIGGQFDAVTSTNGATTDQWGLVSTFGIFPGGTASGTNGGGLKITQGAALTRAFTGTTYGLYIDSSIDTGATAKYSIYSSSTGVGYFAGNIGIATTAPDRALEINNASGNNLRLTYNDSNGSATNYADLSTTSGGDLTIAPSGSDLGITGSAAISSILQVASATGTTYSRFGTATTTHSGAGNIENATDLLLSDDLEVDGDAWFDGNVTIAGTCTGCGGGGGALDTLTASTSDDAALTSGDNTIEWNWALTSATSKGFTIGESAASTGGAGDQHILRIDTASTSTAGPLEIVSNSADGGDIEFNLASAGDFEIQDAGTPFVTFTDGGLVQIASAVTTGTGTSSGISATSSTLTSGTLMDLTVTGAGGLTNQKGLNVSTSGAVTGAQTTYGGYFTNTHTGGTAVNVGLYASASGATGANYAAIFAAGNVGIGDTTPDYLLDVAGNVGIGTGSANAVLYSNSDATDYIEFTHASRSINLVSAGTTFATLNGTAAVFDVNSGNADLDLRVRGQTENNLLFVDASANSVGIGTTGPDRILDVLHASNPQIRLTTTDGSVYSDLQNTATANLIVTGDSLTSSSAKEYGLQIATTVNQTSTASYTALEVATTETAATTLNGLNRLADFRTGVGSKLAISNNGSLLLQNAANLVTPYGSLGSFQNHLVRSEAFDNASWVKTSVTAPTADTQTAPDGSTTAESLATSGSGGDVCQWSGTAAGSDTFTFSVWARSTSGTQNFDLRVDAGATSCATANNVTGTAVTHTATTSWQRFTVTQTFSSATGNVKARIFPGTTGSTGTIYAWGAQVDKDSKSNSYAFTTSGALTNVSRGETAVSNFATQSGFTYGGRKIINLEGAISASSTTVGQFIRVNDNATGTDDTATVRALEVQSYSGTNINGVNTAIAGFGYTFGVHAVSTAQANESSIPAALFADLDNGSAPTQGNAIRAYSNDATSADLVSIYQETSSYSGNALEININGTFTGNFADFQTSGTTKFKVNKDGKVFASLTTNTNSERLCWDGTGGTAEEITDCSGTPGDLAENFGTTDSTIEAGDVVVTDGHADETVIKGEYTTKAFIKKSTGAYQSTLVGVVSTNPNEVYADDGVFSPSENPRPVALVGRVPVKVTTENGPIKPGDHLTSSATQPGKAMKAISSGVVIGQALSGYDGSGEASVIVFVNTGYQSIGNTIVLEAPTLQTQNLQSGTEDLTTSTASTFVIQQQASEEEGSEAVSNILQLQSGDQNRFMVSSTGATSILSNLVCDVTEDACPSVLNVTQANTELMNIDARGTLTLAGTIVIKDDTFAGSVVTDEDGLAEITFSYHLGTGKPVVQLTPEAQIPVFAQIIEFKQDENGNYTGVVMKTFDLLAGPIQAIVHYNVTGKQESYITAGEVTVPTMYNPGDGAGLIIEGGEVIGGSTDGGPSQDEGGTVLETFAPDNPNDTISTDESSTSQTINNSAP